MSHVDEGTLLAYLDREASETVQSAVAEHLATCTSCTEELQRLREASTEAHTLFATLDVAPPVERAKAALDAIRREAEPDVSPAVPLRTARRRRAGRPFRIGLLQAAVLALVLAGVAGAAIPGSPLREWISSALDAVFADEPEPVEIPAEAPVAEPEPEPVPPPAPAPLEMRAAPSNGRVQVVLQAPPVGTRVRVSLTDDPDAMVRADGRLRYGSGRIEAFQLGGGEIVVTLPRSADQATVEVDGRVLVRSEGGMFTEVPAEADASDDEVTLRIR